VAQDGPANAPDSLARLNGMKVYGLDLSYFTGKLQAYLRYCELPFRFVEMNLGDMRKVAQKTGMAQMPAIELADGRWLTDTTAIIDWIEGLRTGLEVTAKDPVLRFFSLLMEDYADEWLWRPALHYRWSFKPDAEHLGGRIAREMMRDLPLPLSVRKALIIRRQKAKYVRGDGVGAASRAHVENIYLRNLSDLEAIFQKRPFMMGNRPSLVDFAFMGPMFRHFSLDPTPSKIMRDQAPGVYEWVARVWNARASNYGGNNLLDEVPQDWSPFLHDMGKGYLPYLAANALAAGQKRSKFSIQIEGVAYHLPVNLNRVHCLARLQAAYMSLPPQSATIVRQRLERADAWHGLWQVRAPEVGFDPGNKLPFLTAKTAWQRGGPRRRLGGAVHNGLGR
jgi:glutathione S-transferase